MTADDSKKYEFREDYVTARIPAWEEHLAGLKGAPGLRFLEIGGFEGRGTLWFLENILTADDAQIVCVDPFYAEGTEARFDKNILLSGVARKVTKLKRPSERFLARRPAETFDLIYVDGDHRAPYVLFDGMVSFTLLKPGGILMFDDYEWHEDRLPLHERPQIAIDVCLETWAGRYDLLHKAYDVILRKR